MKIELKDLEIHSTIKLDAVVVGINIEKRHKEFIKKNNINLSALVRDVLNKLMKGNNK